MVFYIRLERGSNVNSNRDNMNFDEWFFWKAVCDFQESSIYVIMCEQIDKDLINIFLKLTIIIIITNSNIIIINNQLPYKMRN